MICGQVAFLKSVPLRLYANTLIFTKASFDFLLDSMRVSFLDSIPANLKRVGIVCEPSN